MQTDSTIACHVGVQYSIPLSPDNAITRSRTVNKKQVLVLKSCICESCCVIHPLVQSHDGGDIVGTKVRKVMLRGVQWVAVLDAALVVRASKCQEFSWNGVRRRENREEGGREKGEGRGE